MITGAQMRAALLAEGTPSAGIGCGVRLLRRTQKGRTGDMARRRQNPLPAARKA